jgi:ribonuclease HI
MRNRWFVRGPLTCGLCGDHNETLAHLHRECKVVRLAVTRIVNNTAQMDQATILLAAEASDFLFLGENADPKDLVRLLALSYSVWKNRNTSVHCRRTPAVEVLAGRIYRDYRALIKPAFKAVKKERDRTKDRQEFLSLYESLPTGACDVFTDGSCYPETKESGAGFIVYVEKELRDTSSIYLGPGTNNTAELNAVIYSLRHIIELLRARSIDSSLPAYIFSDSSYVLDLISGKSRPRANLALVRTLRELLPQLKALMEVKFHKVPAHANILQNEIVDLVAKRGAAKVTSTDHLPRHELIRLRDSAEEQARKDTLITPRPSCQAGPANVAGVGSRTRSRTRGRISIPTQPRKKARISPQLSQNPRVRPRPSTSSPRHPLRKKAKRTAGPSSASASSASASSQFHDTVPTNNNSRKRKR